MLTSLRIIQVILSVFLAILILLQSKGTGLGSVFGTEGSVFQTRRGIELTIFRFTIGVGAAWVACGHSGYCEIYFVSPVSPVKQQYIPFHLPKW